MGNAVSATRYATTSGVIHRRIESVDTNGHKAAPLKQPEALSAKFGGGLSKDYNIAEIEFRQAELEENDKPSTFAVSTRQKRLKNWCSK